MRKNRWSVFIFIALIGWGCSTNDKRKQAVVSGTFSVVDSISQTADFLPVGITIVQRDSANADPDTLFYAITDSAGAFSGKASFRTKGPYSAFITRDNEQLARMALILAEDDSIEITGRFPDLLESISISSHEHDAMRQYQNLNRGFQRISQYANAGKLRGDSLEQELSKWSDLYLDLYQQNENTEAGKLAIAESVRLLQGWNNTEMMKRIRMVQEKDELVELAADYGKTHIAQQQGLDAALAYLDTLANITEVHEKSMQISMERIALLYDSAHVQMAQNDLEDFRKRYSDDSTAKQWEESIRYDLNYLSPGDTVPEFQFTEKGLVVSRDSLLGHPYLLEVTRLANDLYQEQFDRTVVIHSIYKNYGLDVVTLPLDESQITVDAFFDERVKPWPVADAQAFDRDQLLETFNIRLIPTRFLIDKEGKIVRKYVGREFQDVIKDIQTIINQENQ